MKKKIYSQFHHPCSMPIFSQRFIPSCVESWIYIIFIWAINWKVLAFIMHLCLRSTSTQLQTSEKYQSKSLRNPTQKLSKLYKFRLLHGDNSFTQGGNQRAQVWICLVLVPGCFELHAFASSFAMENYSTKRKKKHRLCRIHCKYERNVILTVVVRWISE